MPSLGDLPREVLRAIALELYNPLELSQQDRLTWGIFSTVDMHPERQDALNTLVALGKTCRNIRREVRIILFRCIRISSIDEVNAVLAADWTRYVRSLIVDLTMFDPDDDSPAGSRCCWAESALLARVMNSLPNLCHLSFFADASDDSTLALLFAALIPRPDIFPVPSLVTPEPQRAQSQPLEGEGDVEALSPPIPFALRLQSFGWRQRATPPAELAAFSHNSTFVSVTHVLKHSPNLSFLVLDADMDEMVDSDVIAAAKALASRPSEFTNPVPVSLMLCGPIVGWNGFLSRLVSAFRDIKELFLDRPLKKTIRAVTDEHEFIQRLLPLASLPFLQILQIGSYTFTTDVQRDIAAQLARAIPSLLALGLLGLDGDTNWWGAWRGGADIFIRPMGDRHLLQLEDLCGRASRRPSLVSAEALIRSAGPSPARSRRTSVDPEGKRSRRPSFEEDGGRVKRAFLGVEDGLRPLSTLASGI